MLNSQPQSLNAFKGILDLFSQVYGAVVSVIEVAAVCAHTENTALLVPVKGFLSLDGCTAFLDEASEPLGCNLEEASS